MYMRKFVAMVVVMGIGIQYIVDLVMAMSDVSWILHRTAIFSGFFSREVARPSDKTVCRQYNDTTWKYNISAKVLIVTVVKDNVIKNISVKFHLDSIQKNYESIDKLISANMKMN